MIRNFILGSFPKILDVVFVISLLVVFMSAVGAAIRFGFISFLITLVAGSCALVLSFGVIYILLDIRDTLERNSPKGG